MILVFGDSRRDLRSWVCPPGEHLELRAANDRIVINGLAGDDVIEASGLAAGAIQLTANGGAATMS